MMLQAAVLLVLLLTLMGLATLFVIICRGLSRGPYFRRDPSNTSTDPKDH